MTEVYFKPEHSHRSTMDFTNKPVEVKVDKMNDEEVMFMRAFKANLREGSELEVKEQEMSEQMLVRRGERSEIGLRRRRKQEKRELPCSRFESKR